MRQAIRTKYLGPTNYRPGRVKAYAEAGSVTIQWDHAKGAVENHQSAAEELCFKFGWDIRGMVGGGSDDQTGYFWVLPG